MDVHELPIENTVPTMYSSLVSAPDWIAEAGVISFVTGDEIRITNKEYARQLAEIVLCGKPVVLNIMVPGRLTISSIGTSIYRPDLSNKYNIEFCSPITHYGIDVWGDDEEVDIRFVAY